MLSVVGYFSPWASASVEDSRALVLLPFLLFFFLLSVLPWPLLESESLESLEESPELSLESLELSLLPLSGLFLCFRLPFFSFFFSFFSFFFCFLLLLFLAFFFFSSRSSFLLNEDTHPV